MSRIQGPRSSPADHPETRDDVAEPDEERDRTHRVGKQRQARRPQRPPPGRRFGGTQLAAEERCEETVECENSKTDDPAHLRERGA